MNEHVRNELATHDSPDANPRIALKKERIGEVTLAKAHKNIVRVDEVRSYN